MKKTQGKKIQVIKSEKERMKKIVRALKKNYPHSKCSLEYKTHFQLLVATVLSAQCTDDRVNKTTPGLFEKYPDAFAMAKARLADLETLVRPTGFYKNKAKSLHSLSSQIVEKFEGRVPDSMEELFALRGVGRKTANVVLGIAFGKPAGVVVDTHVGRISRRLGFTVNRDAVKIETELAILVEMKDWVIFSHLLIDHGRAVCTARSKPKCQTCFLEKGCPKKI